MILSIDVCLDPMPMRVAFLGPEGTYGERAARSLMKLEAIENPALVACSGLGFACRLKSFRAAGSCQEGRIIVSGELAASGSGVDLG